jgi:hypothetical protein
MPDAANDTTYVLLAGNQAGTYTIVSADQTITSIQTADSRPPVDPQVRTRALRGGKRLLTYSQTPAPGQTLELYEEGSGGTGRLLLTTGRSHGQITYRPAPGIGNHRHILAVTIADGLPRDRRSLAPYTIADGPPAKIRHLARHGAKLTWKAPARAVAYAIALTKTNRAQTSRLTRKTAVILPPGIRTATIEPLDTLDRPGPATTINIPPAPKPKHKPPTRNRPTRK